MKLNQDQAFAISRFSNSRKNLFITGAAGTGKSQVLKAIREELEKQRRCYAVVAPTAIAAQVVDGRTWHSYFGVGIMQGGLSASLERSLSSEERVSAFRTLEILIVDEVSFICEEQLRLMSWILQTARNRRSEAFGGVRVIAFGDFCQLPPVPRFPGSRPQFCFQESAINNFYCWKQAAFETITLSKNERTLDREFSKLLENIRVGRPLTDDELATLNSRRIVTDTVIPEDALRIYPTRAMVSEHNESELRKLPGELKEYHGWSDRNDLSERELPLSKVIRLKVGAKVMVRRNLYDVIPAGEVLNGEIGTVTHLSDTCISVLLTEKKERVDISRAQFEILGPDYEVRARYYQFPISLAYAVTVHKSQGQTIKGPVVVNLSGAWLPGQVYVTLSRVQASSQLYIHGTFDSRTFAVTDSRVVAFYRDSYQPPAEWDQNNRGKTDSRLVKMKVKTAQKAILRKSKTSS